MNLNEIVVSRLNENEVWEKEHLLKRNEFLKEEGTMDSRVYHIVEGSVRIFVWDEDEEQIIRFGYQGDIIGCLQSFFMEQPSDVEIQTIRKTHLKSVSKEKFMEFIYSHAENIHLWNQILAASICQQMERERDILISSPQKRYERVLERSPRLFQEIPNKYIANYLRMTPETLSRIKKS